MIFFMALIIQNETEDVEPHKNTNLNRKSQGIMDIYSNGNSHKKIMLSLPENKHYHL